jgi:glycine/D-amino acid oxidase-like deaminating enzyme
VGFGASGRNGGWLSSHFAGSEERLAREHGRDSVIALRAQMRAAVDEVIEVCRTESIDADIIKSGSLLVARTEPQLARMRERFAAESRWGDLGPDDLSLLGSRELHERVVVAGAQGAMYGAHVARVQPAKLVRGLAMAVERLGVTIHESTPVTAIEPRAAITDAGPVSARHVVMCVEGYRSGLPGQGRQSLPLGTAMIVTEPLSPDAWAAIGWDAKELLSDGAHYYVYIQRTADGRIALGGRGVPYRYGSRVDRAGRTHGFTIAGLTRDLRGLFPAAARTPIAHAWCGVMGMTRDMTPSATLDRETGIAIAGGYVGNGVATANLMARIVVELLSGRDGPLSRLPWAGHRCQPWEPEPARFAGIHAVHGLYRAADLAENHGGRAAGRVLAAVAERAAGGQA